MRAARRPTWRWSSRWARWCRRAACAAVGKAVLGLVWISPRRHPDFAFAFLGRTFLALGYHTVAAYQLYILQDYAGLGRVAPCVWRPRQP